MADNFVVASAAGSALTFRSEDIGGVQYPVNFLSYKSGSAAATVSAGDGFPVKIVTDPVPVSSADLTTLVTMVSGGKGHVDIINMPTVHVSSMPALTIESMVPIDVSSLPSVTIGSIVPVDVSSQPARDRTTDNIGVAIQTDALMDDVTVLTPKFASIDTSGANTQIVSAVASKKIRVVTYVVVANSAANVRFVSGSAGGTSLTGDMPFTDKGGAAPSYCPVGHFETAASGALVMSQAASADIRGHLTYVEV